MMCVFVYYFFFCLYQNQIPFKVLLIYLTVHTASTEHTYKDHNNLYYAFIYVDFAVILIKPDVPVEIFFSFVGDPLKKNKFFRIWLMRIFVFFRHGNLDDIFCVHIKQ